MREEYIVTKHIIRCCFLVSLVVSLGCEKEQTTPLPNEDQLQPDPSCSGLYGLPNERSGLTSAECNTSCLCENEDRAFAQPTAESPLFEYRLQSPPSLLGADPYEEESAVESEDESAVESEDESLLSSDEPSSTLLACVLNIDHSRSEYSLETKRLDQAESAYITHLGPCGACSSLKDLQVYLSQTDLTDPVRACGLLDLSQGREVAQSCLSEIGFSEACAEIWYFNTKHTRERCLNICLEHFNASYVNESGDLNPCLACDEEESGPVFKRVAGRTRRNSGLVSAICRPCSTVSQIFHSYLSISD